MGLRALFILSISLGAMAYTLKKPYFGVVYFALITYIRPERLSYHQLAKFHIPLCVGICIIIAWLINYKNLSHIKNTSKVILCLWGLVFFEALSTFTAVYSKAISFHYTQVVFKIVLFCYLMTKLIDSKEKLTHFLIANLLGVAFIAIWGFEQHFRGNIRLEDVAGGNYAESNSIAALFAQFLPIFYSLIFIGTKKIKIIAGIMTIILGTDIIFTQSRAGALGGIIAMFAFLLKLPLRLKIALVIIFIMLYPIVEKAVLGTKGYTERIETTIKQKQVGDRISIWKAGIEMFKDYPLTGVGQQNFQYLCKDYCDKLGLKISIKNMVKDAHNTFLLTLCEGGIFAFLFFMLAIFFYFKDTRDLKKIFSKDSNLKKYIPFVVALQSGMLGFLTCSMFHSYPINENFYWFLVIPGIIKNIYYKDVKL